MQQIEPQITAAVMDLSCEAAVAMRKNFGGTAPDEVRARIEARQVRDRQPDPLRRGDTEMKLKQIAMVMLMLALTATGLTACGGGEPYRPSEIPAKSATAPPD